MRILDPNQLCVVAIVAQLGSVKDAAAKLHRTRPTISNTIRVAEDKVQEKLFIRRFNGPGSRMIPTKLGREILAAFTPALNCMTSIEENL